MTRRVKTLEFWKKMDKWTLNSVRCALGQAKKPLKLGELRNRKHPGVRSGSFSREFRVNLPETREKP
jgi:hypothetical protein